MTQPEGFHYSQRGGDVEITHHGRRATVLRERPRLVSWPTWNETSRNS